MGIAAVVFALVIVWLLFVPATDWLAHHDVGSVTGPLHETALDNARSRLLTLGAGLFAVGALVFTARNFTLSRRTFDLSEQGQVTDRYSKAIEQLGSDKLDMRIGGIYALERVARDSAKDHPTVMEVLAAFIREHCHEQWPLPGPEGAKPEQATRPDVRAALTVIGRRERGGTWSIDLAGAYLAHVNLRGAYLAHVNLRGADLAGADLAGADLIFADLSCAGLAGADLAGAKLRYAKLTDANLTDANLTGADLTGAHFTRANLTHANLSHVHDDATYPGMTCIGAILTRRTDTDHWAPGFAGAILDGADLDGADLDGADLAGADLAGADLGADLRGPLLPGGHFASAHFDGANLAGARWPEDAPVPGGWKRGPSSGRLVRADTGSGPK